MTHARTPAAVAGPPPIVYNAVMISGSGATSAPVNAKVAPHGASAPLPGLLGWPQNAPAGSAQCVTDACVVHTLESGPPQWWHAWQRGRLADMFNWLAQAEAWRRWLEPLNGAADVRQSLHALPVMRREQFRAFVESGPPRVPPSFGRLGETPTSGSTGVPVMFWFTELARRLNLHTFWADNERQGRDLRALTAILTRQPPQHATPHIDVPPDPWLNPGPRVARRSIDFSVEQNARWLCEVAPTYLTVYPALLRGMLDVIETQGLTPPRVRQILTFAETVDAPLRERAARILGARIPDRYSCEEIGPIAFQCPISDAHYHVAVTNAIVEVVDATGAAVPQGQPGSVLVTGLHQWASPAIRYELGDVATLLPCCPACGVTVPALTELLGRKRALIDVPGRGLVYIRVNAGDWLECAPVREFRMLQTSTSAFRVELVGDRPFTADEHAAMQRMLADRVGPGFTFDFHQLPAIEWPAGHKRQEITGLAGSEGAA